MMTANAAGRLRNSINKTHSNLQAVTRVIGNKERVVIIQWDGGPVYLWGPDDWTYYRDQWINPAPYYSPASQRGSHDSRKAAKLEKVAV